MSSGAERERILRDARARVAAEESESLDDWRAAHQARVERLLADPIG